MDDGIDPAALAWAAKFSNVPEAASGSTEANTADSTANTTNTTSTADTTTTADTTSTADTTTTADTTSTADTTTTADTTSTADTTTTADTTSTADTTTTADTTSTADTATTAATTSTADTTTTADTSVGQSSAETSSTPETNAGNSGQQTSTEQSDPPPADGGGPEKITVALLTKYGQTVRYWVQDLSIDGTTRAPEGSGTVLVNGDDHGPDETISLSCTKTANGAVVCFQRESYPNPPGGGLTPWTVVEISAGDTHEILETPQAPASTASPDDASTAPTSDLSPSPAAAPEAAGATADGTSNAAANLGQPISAEQPAALGESDPPTPAADAPEKINVTVLTKYGQAVRYWIQDLSIDGTNEAALGSGTVLIDGDAHGPDERIQLSCTKTINGAALCYQRESYPNPPGGGLTPWQSALVSEGDTFEIPETPQTLGATPQTDDPPAPQATTDDATAAPSSTVASAGETGDPASGTTPPVIASTALGESPGSSGDQPPPSAVGDTDPPAPTTTDAPKKIDVTLVTKYGQTVRYWIQDLAIDANNEAPLGSGTVLVDGDDHGPDEQIGLSCIETANGASICYRRESNPNPPGGGLTPWSSTTIPDGGRFEIPETPQVLDGTPLPPPASDPASGESPGDDPAASSGTDPSLGQGLATDPVGGEAPPDPALLASPPIPSSDTAIPLEQPVGLSAGGKEALTTRAAAEAALYTYFSRALSEQETQTVRITAAVRFAVMKIGANDPALAGRLGSYLSRPVLPGSPRELAAALAAILPEVLPTASIAHLSAAATTDPKDTQAQSAADAVGKGVADQIKPAVRNLPLDRATQDKLLDVARSGSPDAIIAGMNKILDALPLDDKVRASIEAILEAAVKKGSAPMDRQQDGAGSPYANPPPPSVAPDAPKAPGETIIPSPTIPFDTPGVKPPPKADPPPKPQAADSGALASVIAGIDDACLVPASLKGTPAAAEFTVARQVARDLANQMAEAQRAKRATMTFLLGLRYPSSDETMDAFDQLKAIVAKIATALPNRGQPLGSVMLQIAPPVGSNGAAMQQRADLHNGS